MTTRSRPWHGVHVATALPLRPVGADGALAPDFDAYAEHVAWLAANGCDGVVPNGSLGEYQTLTPDERAAVVRTAVAAAPDGMTVMPGVAAYGSAQARRWAEQAAEAGAPCVLLLPPNAYRADDRAVVAHYREVAEVGLPVVAYNNPHDTKVDLTPALLARLFGEGLIVAVKEFSGDVRRAYEIAELAPGLDLLVGSDDVTARAGAGRRGGLGRRLSERPARRLREAVARLPGREIWPRPCRCTGPCTRCCGGTPGPSSSRRSSCRWTSPAATAARAARRALPLLPDQEAQVRAATQKVAGGGPAMRSRRVLHTVESHTEGMPTRVVTGGVGVIPGETMFDRRRWFMANSDGLRTLLMNEPRGSRRDERGDPAAADPPGRRLSACSTSRSPAVCRCAGTAPSVSRRCWWRRGWSRSPNR